MLLKKRVWYLVRSDVDAPPYVFKKFPVFVGRGDSCDIIIDDPSVSEMHAQFNESTQGIVLYDLDSVGGTYVADHRISTLPIIESKDKRLTVSFGVIKCDICYGAVPDYKPAPPKDPDAVWHYEHDGVAHGPLNVAQIFEAVDSDRLVPSDMVWRTGDDVRQPASKVKGLFEDNSMTAGESESSQSVSEMQISLGDSGHGSVTCPCCWYRFNPEDVLFVASHPDLGLDSVVVDEPLRFLPTRFTPEGLAIDAKGMRCTDMACPRCHLRIPATTLTTPLTLLSIVGATGSGKSYFLASAVWRLRTVLPAFFGYSFADADGVVNKWVNNYEESLFFHSGSTIVNPIRKTELEDSAVYKKVNIGNLQGVFLPQPCMFKIKPLIGSDGSEGNRPSCLALYDNAGEHFQVGNDGISRPGTQHLIHSEGIMFLFDPIADPRIRSLLKKSGRSDLGSSDVLMRQDVILVEMISRIRKNLGLMGEELYEKPLVLCLSKADVFGDLIDISDDPWINDGGATHALNLAVVAKASFRVRSILMQYAPEVVTTIESFARNVVYVPVSSLGHNPGPDHSIDPTLIETRWVEVPMLYILGRSGFIPMKRPESVPSNPQVHYDLRGPVVRFQSGSTGMMHEVPWHYSGYELACDKTGRSFVVPHIEQAPVI